MSEGSKGGWRAWAQLVRLPNVFTVIADVAAAFLLLSHGPAPVERFVLIVLAGVALYWAGMILNDLFDFERDKEEQPSRPLPSGAISPGAAQTTGFGLLGLGVLLAAGAGYVGEGLTTTWLPAVVAIALALAIVAYDGPLKKTPLGPALMGACRFLSFLLGASAAIELSDGAPQIPKYVLGAAFGFAVYVMGVTHFARDESSVDESVRDNPINLRIGTLFMIMGVVLLAFAPGLATKDELKGFVMVPGPQFAVLIGLIAMPVIVRVIRAQMKSSPGLRGLAIRNALLSIIPFAAAYALLGAGPKWGLIIFVLVIPAISLAMRLRVT